MNLTRKKRRSLGLCPSCGNKPEGNIFTCCLTCRIKAAERMRNGRKAKQNS